MARFAGILGIGLFALTTISQASVDAKTIKFPVKLDKKDFLAGIWDVGACFVAGQPTKDALKNLAEEGVKTVICLRGVEEMNDRSVVPFDESAYVRELGVNYVHIPLGTPTDYNPDAVKKFAEALAEGEKRGKVLLHCTVAWRASYVWAAYLHRFQKTPLNQAVKAGEAMNMSADRISLLLGSDTNYSAGNRSNAKELLKDPKKPIGGNKLSLKAPAPMSVPDPKDFMSFVMWDMGDVLNASQPTELKLKELAAAGVKTVINIRTAAEMKDVGFDEEAVVKSLGMKYVNIPMQSLDSFNPKNLSLVADALSQSGGKTLLHCFTANRTSNLWIAYLVKYYGVPIEEALRHGEAMRYSNPLEMFLGKRLVYELKPKNPNGRCDN